MAVNWQRKLLSRRVRYQHPTGGPPSITLSPERQKEYETPELQQFLTSIRTREGGRCKRCGRKAKLDVHHIREWAKHPKLRYDPANCVALCRSCHRWVHSRQNIDREYRERREHRDLQPEQG